MSKINYVLTNSAITIVVDGKAHVVSASQPQFQFIKKAVHASDVERLQRSVDLDSAVIDYSHGYLEVRNHRIFYNGQEVHNVVVDRILHFMREDQPFKPLLHFLKKLLTNPSPHSVEQLYSFLAHKGLPLTLDGNFLAYKAIRGDWKDKYSGKFDNSVGSVHEMPRDQVSDDPDVACGCGFHAGSLEYVMGFFNSGDRIVVVEVNPANVVSVPTESGHQKVRVSKYRVVVEHQEALLKFLYNADDALDQESDSAGEQA